MRVLEIGPSPYRSKGGMATVLREIEADKDMCSRFHIEIYDSYIDGSRLTVLLYSVCMFMGRPIWCFMNNYLPEKRRGSAVYGKSAIL